MKMKKRQKSDKAHDETDIQLVKIESKIDSIYNASYSKIATEWDKYMKAHAKDLEKAYMTLQTAMAGGVFSEIQKARAEYELKARQILINNRNYREMSERVAHKITKTNQKAIDYVNGKLPLVYTINYNAFDDTVNKAKITMDYSFKLVNEATVKALAESNRALLPLKTVNVPKDMLWNEQQMNAQVMQGIQQGESIPKIAKRLQNVTDMSKKAAVRNARTMVTAAENKGRYDSYKTAESDGLLLYKRWYCTHDNRVRNWHKELDGISIPIDEPFENSYGELMYPGDPMGDPANVYNCRCRMTGDVMGFLW